MLHNWSSVLLLAKTSFFVFLYINIELIRKEMIPMAEPGGGQQRPGPCYHTAHIFFCYIDYVTVLAKVMDSSLSHSLLWCSTMRWTTEAPFLIPSPLCTSLLVFLTLPKPVWASYNLEASQGSFYPLVRWCFLSSTLLGYLCTQSVIYFP